MIKRMVLKRFFVLVLLFITPVLGLYDRFLILQRWSGSGNWILCENDRFGGGFCRGCLGGFYFLGVLVLGNGWRQWRNVQGTITPGMDGRIATGEWQK